MFDCSGLDVPTASLGVGGDKMLLRQIEVWEFSTRQTFYISSMIKQFLNKLRNSVKVKKKYLHIFDALKHNSPIMIKNSRPQIRSAVITVYLKSNFA